MIFCQDVVVNEGSISTGVDEERFIQESATEFRCYCWIAPRCMEEVRGGRQLDLGFKTIRSSPALLREKWIMTDRKPDDQT